jgi:hypothetical protein
MRARDFAPIKRLDEAPAGPYADAGFREEALSDALRGVDLGAWDELTIGFLVRHLDSVTMRTLVSLVERARCAGIAHALDTENALQRRQRELHAAPAALNPPGFVPSQSGTDYP